MKKKRKRIFIGCLLFAMLVSMLVPTGKTESYQAATSYTNAKEFYESTQTIRLKKCSFFNEIEQLRREIKNPKTYFYKFWDFL